MPYAARLLPHPLRVNWHVQLSSPSPIAVSRSPLLAASWIKDHSHRFPYKLCQLSCRRSLTSVPKSSPESDGIVPADDAEDGVSLGTLKLPSNTDLQRFETLLFQVDKVPGGTRLGFISIGDGKTEVLVYIDCLVYPATANDSGPIFRAIRNGPLKDQSPPGEPRIMRSLLQALQKSVEIARV
ncbi:hypothetical protein F2P56_005837 [Juglans regia]|uniref:DUF7148 domain-containing protein n=2 Tax=Juglans regia TaxID=51240 RepID=A0A833XZU1_JUGRE|nr:uncharacterized protein LOC109012192 isoform X2 [Juglans regia]KAF5473884.1 hypothetical protein F2P56_005837 [Juglans regia]